MSGTGSVPPKYARGLPQPVEESGPLRCNEDHLATDLKTFRKGKHSSEMGNVTLQPGLRNEEGPGKSVCLLFCHFCFPMPMAETSVTQFVSNAEAMANLGLA